jgi:3-hydroxyisobutyrate dehydrogenase-like beta-hydroxyacid dehydrogenase
MASLGEALALARRVGLNSEAVVGVFDVTDYSSGLIRGVSRAPLRNDFSPSFYLRQMLKDVRLIEDLARRLAVPPPTSAGIGPLFQSAVNQGLGDLNASGVPAPAGVKPAGALIAAG